MISTRNVVWGFENKVLRKIFGAKRDEITGEWRKLHSAELHASYSSPGIIRNLKSRRGAKGDWDFRISDLVKNPDGTDI